jgi:hypothetical protein
LPHAPDRATLGHVGPLLLAGPQHFFFRVSRSACSARHKVVRLSGVLSCVFNYSLRVKSGVR